MTQTENKITQEFCIPEQNISYLEEQIALLNKRAKRLNCSQIMLETLSTETIENDGDVSLYFYVQVSGEAPRIKGWAFVAVLEHLDSKEDDNLVHAVPDMLQDSELVKYRHMPPYCEHCQTRRQRNNTYILKNEQGLLKQVGRQCLIDFLGHDDPMAVAYDAQFIAEACELAEKCSDDDFQFGRSSSNFLSTEYFLAWVHASIRQTGWCSRKDAESYGKTSTASAALYNMEKHKQHPSTYEKNKPTEHDRELAKKALEWIREGDRDWNTASDFLYSLHIVCKSDVLARNHTGIAAALFVTYNKAMEAERERQSQMVSEWQGNVGEKIIVTITCDSVFYQESCYGRRVTTTAIYKLSDANGNRFTWFSSNDVLEVGNTYTLKGTIKGHDEYKGVKQSIITRCKVQ